MNVVSSVYANNLNEREKIMKMKLLLPTVAAFIAVGFIGVAPALAKMEYQCHRYEKGKPTGGFVRVTAENKHEATRLAMQKYDKLGKKYSQIKCK